LIAHELAHTRQTRRTGSNSASPKALERNAHDLAAGRSGSVLAAPRRAVLPDLLPGEEWWQEPYRLIILQHYRRLLLQLQAAIDNGTLLPSEAARSGDRIMQMFTRRIYSRTARDAVLRRLIDSLTQLVAQMETTAVPMSWYEPAEAEYNATASDANDEMITNAVMFHLHWSADRDRPWSEVSEEHYYIYSLLAFASDTDEAPPATTPTPRAPDTGSGEMSTHDMSPRRGTGYWVVVPDPERDPETVYHYSAWAYVPRGGLIVEIERDEVGYFYVYHSRRVYVPRYR
jgi:hypothetical protein